MQFKHVFIHGLVRDGQGRKMSKSLGNGVDPLEVIDKYGADALRFMLANGTNAGNDMRYTEERNWLINALYFVLSAIGFIFIPSLVAYLLHRLSGGRLNYTLLSIVALKN